MTDKDGPGDLGDEIERWLRAGQEGGSDTVQGVFSDAELETLIEVFIEGNGPSTEEQLATFVSWATRVRINAAMLDLVIQRRILPVGDPQAGDLTFRAK